MCFRYKTLGIPQYDTEGKRKNVIGLLCLVWCLATLWAIMPLAGWTEYALQGETLVCGAEWRTRSLGTISFHVSFLFLGICSPIVIKAICYRKIYSKVSRVRNVVCRNQNTDPGDPSGMVYTVQDSYNRPNRTGKRASITSEHGQSTDVGSAIMGNFSDHPRIKSRFNRTQNIRKLRNSIFFIVVMSCIIWLPYGVLPVILHATASDFSDWWMICALLAKCCVIYNPLVYVTFNRKFRRDFFQVLRCQGNSHKIAADFILPVLANDKKQDCAKQLSDVPAVILRRPSQKGLYVRNPRVSLRHLYSEERLSTIKEDGSNVAMPGSRSISVASNI